MVTVTTADSTHDQFIKKGLEFGCDVMTEKPLTTDAEKCQNIIDAERRAGKNVIVAFNYRWNHYFTRIKELLQEDTIGKLVSVDFRGENCRSCPHKQICDFYWEISISDM